jgi:hypothetical protein
MSEMMNMVRAFLFGLTQILLLQRFEREFFPRALKARYLVILLTAFPVIPIMSKEIILDTNAVVLSFGNFRSFFADKTARLQFLKL